MSVTKPDDVVDLAIDEVKRGLADGSILLVDVRESEEYAAGHIPASVSVPLSTFDPAALPEANGRRIVFSCNSGGRTLRALAATRAAGLDLREHYKGSFKDWVAHGEPVTTGEEP
ncbi:MAG: rhodanese-like domain-containing protein [Pseudochelatococcus sp.]|jgi:rhodanese-related sulfurtransferase|uniref:rhodanese-like domain-containing protein n=1 Tax=Pseudochelatococcus sp. TaxID=2020869 RepID=UPI003D94022F